MTMQYISAMYLNSRRLQNREYIRPIVLFQAQPKNKYDIETFDKVKKMLIEIGIPEE